MTEKHLENSKIGLENSWIVSFNRVGTLLKRTSNISELQG